MASTSEKARTDQVVAEFFGKSLQIILDARLPFISSEGRREAHGAASSSSSSSPSSALRGANRWFNLELEAGRADLLAEHVEPWRRIPSEALVLDIFLQQPAGVETSMASPASGGAGAHAGGGSGGGRNAEEGSSITLLERWVVHYERLKRAIGETAGRIDNQGGGTGTASGGQASSSGGPGGSQTSTIEVPVVYKHTVIMLRSLYCLARALPAHRLFRLARSLSNHRNFSLTYRLPSCASPLSEADAAAMSTWSLTPVATPWGRMCLSVAYRQTTAVTALEVSPSILPRIISDYVGSPTTDPLRRFPAAQVGLSIPSSGPAGRAVHIVPLVTSGPITSPSSAPLGRRSSWGTSQSAHPHNLHSPTSPSAHPSRSSSTSPSSVHQPYPVSQPIPIQHHPSSASRSPSPSPPAHFQDHLHRTAVRSFSRSTSAPVSIPRAASRGSGGFTTSGNQASRTSGVPFPPHPPLLARNLTVPAQAQGNSPTLAEPFSLEATRGGHRVSVANMTKAQSLKDGSIVVRGGIISSSPPLPFASTPTNARQLLPMAPYEGQLAAISRATPPISGGETSALALSRLPSFSLSADIKLPAPLSISPLADSALLMSPPHPFHKMHQAVGISGPPSGGRLSVYRAPQLGYGGTMASDGGRDEDDDFALPFAVDDEELIRRSRGDGGTGAWLTSPGGGGVNGDSSGQSALSSRQSQDAAVGALVRSLRAAPPLRQGSLSGSSAALLSSSPRFGGHGLKGNQVLPSSGELKGRSTVSRSDGGGVGEAEGSTVLSRRTSAEALKELKAYSEMRQVLLRQRGEASVHAGSTRGGGGVER